MPNPKNIEKHKFKKGQSGNPKGRPPKLPGLDELVTKVLGEEKSNMTATEALLRKLLQRAMTERGSTGVRAAELLLERGYGKVIQKTENTNHTIKVGFSKGKAKDE